MDNKFPGKDVSEEDIKTKFPLVAKKIRIINQNSKFQMLNLVVILCQYLLDLIWLKLKI